MTGDRLGPYEIVDKLGEGGMGVVYRARDTTLQRDVAIKVLPEHLGADPDRLVRFQREAEALAALNHPSIAHIYGLETGGASPAIVMELVEGPTLADRLRSGRIPLDEALPIARQIADALEAAHERGIVHRDLKPANVKVTADGSVKVLDFGLAKVIEPPGEFSAEVANSPTLTAHGTQMGVILGTAAYMAPEQAKGTPIDKRADLWAFGCVLYEMLTGRRAFEGDDVSDTLANVLKLAPDFDAVPATTPPSIARLLRRCLEKDRRKRLADAADARLEIDEALAASDADSTQPVRATPAGVPVRTTALVAVAALIVGGLLAGLAAWARSSPLDPRPVRFIAVAEPFDVVGVGINSHDLAFAPDGTKVVLAAPRGQLAVRDLETLGTTQLSSVGRQAFGPFISPDGAWVGFNDQSDRTIKRVSILGGPAVEVGPVGATLVLGASWGEDDSIVFGTNALSGLWRIPASGGTPEPISTRASGVNHAWPDILPGGGAVLFTILAQPVEQSQIALLDLETGEHTVLIPGGSYPRYVPTGHIVYGVDGALRAVGFDLRRRQVTTSPVPVVDGVLTKASGAVGFAVAGNGSLVYLRGTAQAASRTLVWVDRGGHEEPLTAPPRAYFTPRLSPDGTRVALNVRDEENDIWIWDLERETMTRLTFDPRPDWSPVWSPTGDRIAFSSQREGSRNLYWKAANGTGTAERLTDSENGQFAMSFTQDDELLFVEGRASNFDLMALSVQDTDRRPRALVESSYEEWNGEVSPNGRWLAYQSNESGRSEIYVRPFPDVEDGEWQVTTDEGTRPVWRGDSGELFYYSAGRVIAVPIESGSTFIPGTPTVLFEGDFAMPGYTERAFDVTEDGQRFIFIKDSEDVGGDGQQQVLAVLNWFQELQRLVPVRR